jgi:hypothetical protein
VSVSANSRSVCGLAVFNDAEGLRWQPLDERTFPVGDRHLQDDELRVGRKDRWALILSADWSRQHHRCDENEVSAPHGVR